MNWQRGIITSKLKVRLSFFFLCTSSEHALYTYKGSWRNLNSFKVIEQTQNIAWNKQRCIHVIMSELKVELRLFFSVHCLIMPYICTKFHEEILTSLIELTWNIAIWTLALKCDPWCSFGRIDLLVLHIILVWRTFTQSFKKILQSMKETGNGHKEQTNGWTDRRTMWQHNTTRLFTGV